MSLGRRRRRCKSALDCNVGKKAQDVNNFRCSLVSRDSRFPVDVDAEDVDADADLDADVDADVDVSRDVAREEDDEAENVNAGTQQVNEADDVFALPIHFSSFIQFETDGSSSSCSQRSSSQELSMTAIPSTFCNATSRNETRSKNKKIKKSVRVLLFFSENYCSPPQRLPIT